MQAWSVNILLFQAEEVERKEKHCSLVRVNKTAKQLHFVTWDEVSRMAEQK